MADIKLLQGLVKMRVGRTSELADKIGFSLSYTSSLLNGKRGFSTKVIDKLIVALNLSKEETFDIFFKS